MWCVAWRLPFIVLGAMIVLAVVGTSTASGNRRTPTVAEPTRVTNENMGKFSGRAKM